MKKVTMDKGATPPPVKDILIPENYIKYRLDELVKANQNVITEYNFLMQALHPAPVQSEVKE